MKETNIARAEREARKAKEHKEAQEDKAKEEKEVWEEMAKKESKIRTARRTKEALLKTECEFILAYSAFEGEETLLEKGDSREDATLPVLPWSGRKIEENVDFLLALEYFWEYLKEKDDKNAKQEQAFIRNNAEESEEKKEDEEAMPRNYDKKAKKKIKEMMETTARRLRRRLYWVVSSDNRREVVDLPTCVTSYGVIDKVKARRSYTSCRAVRGYRKYYSPLMDPIKRNESMQLLRLDATTHEDELVGAGRGVDDPLAIVRWSEEIATLKDHMEALLRRRVRGFRGMLLEEAVRRALIIDESKMKKRKADFVDWNWRFRKKQGLRPDPAVSSVSLVASRIEE